MATLDAPKTASPMEQILRNAQISSEGAWSFVCRVKTIREVMIGCTPEPVSASEKASSPPVGVVSILQDSHRNTEAAFNALNEELRQIEECLGL